MTRTKSKLDIQAKMTMSPREANVPILCDLLCVVRDQGKRQILLDMSTLLLRLQGDCVEILLPRECYAFQNINLRTWPTAEGLAYANCCERANKHSKVNPHTHNHTTPGNPLRTIPLPWIRIQG